MKTKFLILTAACLLPITFLLSQTTPGTILWVHEIGSSVISSPAVARDGRIFVGTSSGLIAVTNTGSSASNLWTFPLANSAAIGPDGTIYSGGNGLYAISPSGSQEWAYGVGTGAGVPAIGFDRTVYFQSAEFLYALTDTGTFKWKSPLTFPGSYSAPTIGLDGTIYIASSYEANLYAFNPDGAQRWVRSLDSPCGDSPAVGSDGTIFITGGDLYAFTPEGTNLWHTSGFFKTSPVIGHGGTGYIAKLHFPGTLYRVSNSGVPSGTDATELITYTAPKCAAIDAGGTVWYCASNMVWALNANGQALPWSQVVDSGYPGPGTSPVIGPDGTLFSARGSRLYAIATGTNGPADSAWPMYRGNARHTGKIEKTAINQPKKRADANFEFQLYAQLGQTNVIQTTTNLNSWTSLTSVVVTTVPQPVVDLTASNHPARFYRSTAP